MANQIGKPGKNENPVDPNTTERLARAKKYFEVDLEGKPKLYGERASSYKVYGQFFSLLIIFAGSLTAFLGVYAATTWVSVSTACLGALVAVAKGWEHIARYEERWISYRIASERMRRECRLYVNGAGTYRDIDNEEDAYVDFVDAIET
ncbi:MAG: DUF4231 domain-containing protein, partial [Pseudomonadota bacterium]